MAASNLEPAPGENQRFCYNITGIGEDNSSFADLSHFVLGICEEITKEQIANIIVIIDGEEQDVIFDENVELRPPSNPDPPTGCSGLKFDFGLDKVEGEMTVCFELITSYPIGANGICLFGGGRTASGLDICGPACEQMQTCRAVAYQPLTVCVPVTIKPFARSLPTITFCCGDPMVAPGNACGGIENGSCSFTVTQQMCVSVPIEFGATPTVNKPFVHCGDPSADDICTGCGSPNNTTGVVKKPKKKSTCKKC